MVRTQIYIREDQHEKLKGIYAKTGQRITESIREAVDDFLEKKGLLKVQDRKDG